MDTITTAATTYTPPSTSVVHNAGVSLTDRSPASVVHLVQYDNTLPIVAVALTANGQAYTVPTGAAVNVRMRKPDGKYVYDPALGVSEDAQTAYIAVTLQMAAAWGKAPAVIEIVVNGNVAATGTFICDISENPVPESAIESSDEWMTIEQILQQVEEAAAVVRQNAQNLQNLTDNLEAVQNAAANAQAAAASAAQAAQSAQQALGFRTFFDAISPDANGSLDPSRPMTTAAAQASWTVKSKGDRIQSVRVNGFTSDGQSGGLRMVELVFDGSSDEPWTDATTSGVVRYKIALAVPALGGNASQPNKNAFSGWLFLGNSGSTIVEANTFVFNIASNTLYVRTNGESLASFKERLAENNLYFYYTPEDQSQATGLYIPIQAQGHEYRCQCLPVTEALGVGDNVQSNVPSGCDATFVLDGTQDLTWNKNDTVPYGGYFTVTVPGLPASISGQKAVFMLSDQLVLVPTLLENYSEGCMSPRTSAEQLNFTLFGQKSVEDANSYLSETPITLYWQSTAYTEQNDIFISLETHASGNVYAHPAVNLVAVPYTDADVAAANQLASTPSTLPYIDSPDVPMLLDAAEPEQTAPAALAVNAIPVAGTYVVSSQNGTTVAVTLKAFQDGGDAATLGGQTLEQINADNANTYLTKEQLLTLIYPVGSIYMSANDVSPQTFLGGTWQQIQGQFLLAASDDYAAGSTGGAAEVALTVDQIPSHSHSIYSNQGINSADDADNSYAFGKGYWIQGAGTSAAGGGQAHNNMPPYLAVYMWQRTA